MNASPSLPHLRAAKQALHNCLQLMDSEALPWDELVFLLSKAQGSIAVAAHLSLKDSNETETVEALKESAAPASAPAPEFPEWQEEPVAEAAYTDTTKTVAVDSETHPPARSRPVTGPSLAEKLSEQPLSDLTGSLSINNRVRFAALLTDGDVPEFLQLCRAIEQCNTFEEAQLLLLQSGSTVDWEDEELGGMEFLNLVRRLFALA